MEMEYLQTSTEFLKVRVSKGTMRLIRVIRRGANGLIIGKRITIEGDDWYHETRDTVTEELVVTNDRSVVQRLRMNLHYGELEPIE
jgi:hypothetical protein